MHLCIYENVFLSVLISTYMSVYLFIYMTVFYKHLSTFLSIYISLYLYVSICLHSFPPVGIKLVLNILLNRYLSIARQSDKMIRLICVNYADQSSDAAAAATNNCSLIKLETYLIKTKTIEVR